MEKINKYIKKIIKINKYLIHVWTIGLLVVTLFDFDLNILAAYFVYMTYSFYILLEEFVRNHRMMANMEYRDFLDKRGLREETKEERESESKPI